MMLLDYVIISAVAVVIQCIDCYDDSSSVPSHAVSCGGTHNACFVEYISLTSEDETVKEEWNRFCTYDIECRYRGLNNKCLKLHQLTTMVQESFWKRLFQSGKITNPSQVRDRNSRFCCCTSPSLCNDMTGKEQTILENSSFPSLRTHSFNIAISVSHQATSICLLYLLPICLSLFAYY